MSNRCQNNKQHFSSIKRLNLPAGHYAITGSGPMGIRNLREIADIDIIVDKLLWNSLAKTYGIVDTGQIKKIQLPNEDIEVMGENSFYTDLVDPNAPTISERIAQAEIIEGLPFESLEHVLYYKRKMGREKDIKDIEIIQACLKRHSDDLC